MKYSERYVGGIYTIRNKVNGNLYVGSAASFYRRWAGHKSHLRANEHDNPKLQNAWNKYGESSFEFLILEIIEHKEFLLNAEQFYLDIFFGESCYNILPAAKNRMGAKTSDFTKDKLRKYKNIIVKSPNGTEHIVENIKDFSKTHNLQVTALCEVIAKKRLHHKGWHLPETILPEMSFISPDGKMYTFIFGELESFCKDNLLDPSAMRKLHTGEKRQHKNWYPVCRIGKQERDLGTRMRGYKGESILKL